MVWILCICLFPPIAELTIIIFAEADQRNPVDDNNIDDDESKKKERERKEGKFSSTLTMERKAQNRKVRDKHIVQDKKQKAKAFLNEPQGWTFAHKHFI